MKRILLIFSISLFTLAINYSCVGKYSSEGVLVTFGEMNKKLEDATILNHKKLDSLLLANPHIPKKYADKIKILNTSSKNFNNYIEIIKNNLMKGIRKDDYNALDKSSSLDSLFFKKNSLSENGVDFIKGIKSYKSMIIENFKDDFPEVTKKITANFDTNSVDEMNWLEYNFKEYPLITSITKLSQIQSDINLAQTEILTSILNIKNKSNLQTNN